MTERYIRMSSSANGTLTDGQDVTYKVGFTVADDTQDIGGIVIEFCSDTPIIGDTCTAPTGMDVDAANLALNQPGFPTGFTVDVAESTANKVVLNHVTDVDPDPAEDVEFDLGTAAANDGIDNPETTNTTFYARILTYTTATGADDYTSTDLDGPGNATPPVDAGGIALSTAAQITITAKVPEKLTFCVYTSISANTCSGVTGTAITLGDDNGVLSDVEEFVNKDAQYTVATNALYGVAIRIKGGTLKTSPGCPETPGQSCSIDAALPTGGPPGTTPVASVDGSEQFGFCTYASAGGATLTPAAPYNDADCNTTVDNANDAGNNNPDDAALAGTAFAFDNDIINNPTNATISTYGQIIANKAAGTFSTGVLAFLGNITTTTEPGIYTTTLTFIATGTY